MIALIIFLHQRVVAALAGEAGDVRSVSEFSEVSRSLVSPAEQPCEQIKGICSPTGWRASAGSGGMSRGGDVLSELLAQPISNDVRSTSGSIRGIERFFCIDGYPGQRLRRLAIKVIRVRQVFDLLRLTGDRCRLVGIVVPLPISAAGCQHHSKQ